MTHRWKRMPSMGATWILLACLSAACSSNGHQGQTRCCIYPDVDATSTPALDAAPPSTSMLVQCLSRMPSKSGTRCFRASSSCEINEVLERNGCFACHGANAELSGAVYISHLTDSKRASSALHPRVQAVARMFWSTSAPEASILLHTLNTERDRGGLNLIVTIPMPLGSTTALSSEDVECVEQWIRTLNLQKSRTISPLPPAITVLTRVKYLLDGGALSAEELESARGPNGALLQEGLNALVATWLSGDRFRAKRRQFLELQLQQTPSDMNYFNQFRNTRTNSLAPVRESLNQSIIRTAERIIDEGEDFRSIVTTRR